MERPRGVFDEMVDKDLVCWGAMINGYASNGLPKEALELFSHIQRDKVKPDCFTFVRVLSACASIEVCGIRYSKISSCKVDNKEEKGVEEEFGDEYKEDEDMDLQALRKAVRIQRERVCKACLELEKERLAAASSANETMVMIVRLQSERGGSVRGSRVGADGYYCCHVHYHFHYFVAGVLFTAPRHGRCSHGYLNVYGFAIDTSICKALVDMYSKCGRIDFAKEVFNRMPKRDIISWNAMIAGYGIHGLGREALLLFHDLQNEGPKLDYVTFICLLSACSHSGLVLLLA
ncbi:hypothetical protein IFM89_027185 [Coptis chinensis]|uniref:GTD-binding domain-containing protein n=1 Tax=Coptis chinensis TaxID=261450 RepID=A0A835IE51_9MAGN|nr:hypothetical protein IFM89_027185 [Coptis chinensis]